VRRALLIAYDFPPIASAAAQRSHQLARHLPAHGWRPIVVTPRTGVSWAHDDRADALPVDLEVRRTRSLEPTRILRVARRENNSGAGTARLSRVGHRVREWALVPDSRVGWIPFALASALRSAERAEVIVTTSPPVSAHIVGYAVARATGRPWVVDFQDPWSLPDYQPWAGRFRPWVDARLERAVLQRADRVVATTAWLAEHLAQRGGGERVHVVSNGFDPEEFPPRPLPPHADGTFSLVHAGSFYGPRTPEPLLSAVAAALSADPRIRSALRLRLLGSEDGENAARLDAAVRRLGLADVVERPRQMPRREAMAAMRDAAVLVLVTDSGEGGRGLVPLKLYEYLGARRPVLALTPPGGEAGRLVRAAGGTAVDPHDTEGAAGALLRLYERWRAGPRESAVPAIPLGEYHWDRLARGLAEILSDAASEPRARAQASPGGGGSDHVLNPVEVPRRV
jgi:glycosyltransferase involved in cell wall biosynthesis